MTPTWISVVSFACIFGGAAVGLFLAGKLPANHLSEESKRIVNLGTGVIGTMAALVLGLLVTSAKTSYDRQGDEIVQLSAKMVLLDRVLAHYGPETREVRAMLREAVGKVMERLWPKDPHQVQLAPNLGGSDIYERLEQLTPETESQKNAKAQALKLGMELGESRLLMYERQGVSISGALVGVVVFWLAINFIGLGLYAPRNLTVVISLLLCALSISVAIFLMLEMFKPFEGVIRLSDAPMRNALAQMGR